MAALTCFGIGNCPARAPQSTSHCSGRLRMLRKLLFSLGVLTLGLFALVSSCSDDAPSPTGPTTQTDTPPESGGLSIGPVPGLTTAWHAAPAKFSVTKDVN